MYLRASLLNDCTKLDDSFLCTLSGQAESELKVGQSAESKTGRGSESKAGSEYGRVWGRNQNEKLELESKTESGLKLTSIDTKEKKIYFHADAATVKVGFGTRLCDWPPPYSGHFHFRPNTKLDNFHCLIKALSGHLFRKVAMIWQLRPAPARACPRPPATARHRPPPGAAANERPKKPLPRAT
ncbi:hypothetical protein EVAR_14078_1 [Eumeta japonica]|uniref:Uncharacterized protein n=1 Tax=Eumeta variegata TaxID=151549 RepID=A0A4C1UNH9_EUMVA|nr:hypothetical protein EVAR_14078_1 [Eumeta japonica]